MPVITDIDGSLWPTDGVADALSVGVDSLAGNWTHVGSADVPIGTTGTGYLQLPSGEGGNFRIDTTVRPFTTDDDYWIRLWMYAENDGALPVDGTSWFPHIILDTGTRLRMQGYLRNNGITNGFTMAAFEFQSGGSSSHISNVGGSGGPAVIPFDCWVEIASHVEVARWS